MYIDSYVFLYWYDEWFVTKHLKCHFKPRAGDCGVSCTCAVSCRRSPRGPRCRHWLRPPGGRSPGPGRTPGADCGPGAAAPRPPHLCAGSTPRWTRPWSSWPGSGRRSWSSSSEPRSRVRTEASRAAPRSPPCRTRGGFYRPSRWRAGPRRSSSSSARLCAAAACGLVSPWWWRGGGGGAGGSLTRGRTLIWDKQLMGAVRGMKADVEPLRRNMDFLFQPRYKVFISDVISHVLLSHTRFTSYSLTFSLVKEVNFIIFTELQIKKSFSYYLIFKYEGDHQKVWKPNTTQSGSFQWSWFYLLYIINTTIYYICWSACWLPNCCSWEIKVSNSGVNISQWSGVCVWSRKN